MPTPSPIIVQVLAAFAGAFTRPTFEHVLTLRCGTLLASVVKASDTESNTSVGIFEPATGPRSRDAPDDTGAWRQLLRGAIQADGMTGNLVHVLHIVRCAGARIDSGKIHRGDIPVNVSRSLRSSLNRVHE